MKPKILTGVGSRETPLPILQLMRKVSKKMVLEGYTLRSGGADGADEYFAYGWGDAYAEDESVTEAEIYLPWNGFNNLYANNQNCKLVKDPKILKQAEKIVESIHPAFNSLSRGGLALHTRNCFQVLGENLNNPSSVVLCYAKLDNKGEPQGGTRTAIKLAQERGIRVNNLIIPEDHDKVMKYLEN